MPNAKVDPLLCDVQAKIVKLFCRELYLRKIGEDWTTLNHQGMALLNTMYALQNNPQSLLLEYEYIYLSAVTATDPESGNLKFNHATLASATALYIDETNGVPESIATEISKATKIMVYKAADPAIYAVYTVNSIVDNGSWNTLYLTYVEGAGALTNLDPVVFVIQNNDDEYVDILKCWFTDRYNK